MDRRVQQLLEEHLDSGDTPEVVCRACPELLPQVLERLQRLRALQTQVAILFPAPGSIPPADSPRPVPLAADPDLAGLRDPGALNRLPPAERQECRALWSDLDALLERVQAPK